MTVEQAEALVREYWASPVLSPLREAARVAWVMSTLRHCLSPADRAALLKALGRVATGHNWQDVERVVDRRSRMHIPRPEVDPRDESRAANRRLSGQTHRRDNHRGNRF